MNVGQAFGELQLRIHDLEERRTRADRVDQGELDEAKADLLAFGLKLAAQAKEIESLHETVHKLRMAAKQSGPVRKAVTSSAEVALREENVALETQLRAMTAHGQAQQMRIARLEAATKALPSIDSGELAKAQEQAAEYKRHIERLEAEARGYAMQITDLKRQRDELQAKYGEGLRASVRESRATPVQTECQVCRSIKLMVLGVEPVRPRMPSTSAPSVIHRLDDSRPVATEPEPEPEHHPNHMSPQAARGIANGIRAALATAKAPMLVREIARVIGIDSKRVATNIPPLVSKGDVTRMVVPSQGAGWCYWLKSRPLPQQEGVKS